MDVKKLKEDVYRIPLDRLKSHTYYDRDFDRGCLVGHLGLLNGISTEELAKYNQAPKMYREEIMAIYNLPHDGCVASIEGAFDRYFDLAGAVKTHDELWDIVKSALIFP